MEMSNVWLRRGHTRNDWATFFATDEHGCVLHTEPVCSVYVGKVGHQWFSDWLEGREMIIEMPALLTHFHEKEIEPQGVTDAKDAGR